VIAGWDNFDNGTAPTVTVTATDVTASLATTGEGRDWIAADGRGSSSDGTWGTSVGPPSADPTAGGAGDPNLNLELSNATTGGTITLTITNNSGADIPLEAFHMDALAFRPKAPRSYTLDVLAGGAINDGEFINIYDTKTQDPEVFIKSQGSVPPDNNQGDDIDHDLTFLGVSILEDGGTVEFLLTFSGGVGDNSGGHDLWVDNLAVTSSSANANRLGFTVVPASATAGEDFIVTVEAQDSNGTALFDGVSEATQILLTTASGTGTLSGATATIPAGESSVELTTLRYNVAEDINLIASQVSGDLLAPSAESSTITINAGPASVLNVEFSSDPEINDPVGNQSFRIKDPVDTLDVFAVSRDSVGNFIAFRTDAVFTLADPTGDITEFNLTDNMDGSATFSASALGTATIRATVDGLPVGDSGLITVEEPQFRWTGGNGGLGNAALWLDGISPFAVQDPPIEANTIDLFFYDEYTSPSQLFLSGDRTVRSMHFTEFVDPTAQGGLGIRYTQGGVEGPVDLTFDTDSPEENPAAIFVAAGAEATINMGNVNAGLRPDTDEFYGDMVLADSLLITHLGTGNLLFSRPIKETGGSKGVTIDATSTGTVVYDGANTYSGPTTVNGGVLRLTGDSIADNATLVINEGGVVDVAADERMVGLSLPGMPDLPDGEYGSLASGAENTSESLTGTGRITVGPAPVVPQITITDISFTAEEEITITFTSNDPVDVYGSSADDGFVWQLFEANVPSGTWVDTLATEDQIFYILVTSGEDPPADSP
jgi:autotransporter-associated beta strand protein